MNILSQTPTTRHMFQQTPDIRFSSNTSGENFTLELLRFRKQLLRGKKCGFFEHHEIKPAKSKIIWVAELDRLYIIPLSNFD